MISQLTRQRILENAEKQALENSKVQEVKIPIKTSEVEKKPESSVEVIEEPKTVGENSTVEESKKKTDAEKLKKKKE